MNPLNIGLISPDIKQPAVKWMIQAFAIMATLLLSDLSYAVSPDHIFYKLNRTAQRDGTLYSQPETNAPVLADLKKGMSLTLIDEKGEWFIARLTNDQVGWVHESLLSGETPQASPPSDGKSPHGISPSPELSDNGPVEPPAETDSPQTTLTVKVPSARVRKLPDLESNVIFGLKKGDTVASLGFQAPWYQIRRSDGKVGWAHQSLFDRAETTPSISKPESSPPLHVPESVAAADNRLIRDIRIDLSPDGAEKAIFELSGFHPPETFVLEETTPKIVCDFYDLSPGKDMRRRIDVGGTLIQRIRTGMHSGDRPKLRVVVDLASNQDYEVEQVFYKQQNLYILTIKPTTVEKIDTL